MLTEPSAPVPQPPTAPSTSGATAVATATVGGTAAPTPTTGDTAAPSPTVGETPVATPTVSAGPIDLVVAQDGEPEQTVRRAIAALDGMEGFVPLGHNVIIKYKG